MIKTFYLLIPGKLTVKDANINFEDISGVNTVIPIKQITDLYLCLDINPTSNVLKLIMDEGIIIHYFNNYEYYLGSLIPKKHKNSGKTIVKEVECFDNLDKRIQIAKKIIKAALKNISKVVKYYQRRKGIVNNLNLNYYSNKINEAKTINHLMLIEAEYRKNYYNHYPEILNLESFIRVAPNATDIVNVLLNLMNSLLYSVIYSEIKKTNLSGFISYLHEPDHDRVPLIYDISEIFKPLYVDRVVFRMINRKQVNDNDLINNRLSNDAIKIVFKEWNTQLNTTIHHPKLKRSISYRMLIRQELYELEKHIANDKDYKTKKEQ